MTTTEGKAPKRERNPELAASWARAVIAMSKVDDVPVEQWVLDVAAGKPLPKDRPPLDLVTGDRMAS